MPHPGSAFLGCLLLMLAPVVSASMRETLSVVTLLDGAVDNCVVKFELTDRQKSARNFYGIALHFDGILWLYVPGLGTRCLGPASSADDWASVLQERLQRRDAHGPAIKLYPSKVPIDRSELSQSLDNGCFAGCVYKLSQLLADREPVVEAGVLFFSVPERVEPATPLLDNLGHALLVFRSEGRWRVYDPAREDDILDLSDLNFTIGSGVDARLLDFARLHGHPTQVVRFFPFSPQSLRDLAFRTRRPRR